jgi:hypothetical protein
MKKLIIIVCIGLFLSGYCLGAVSPAKQARNDLARVRLVAEDGSEVLLTEGRTIHDALIDNKGHQYKKLVQLGNGGGWRALGISLDDLVNKSVNEVYILQDGRILKCTLLDDGKREWRIELPSGGSPSTPPSRRSSNASETYMDDPSGGSPSTPPSRPTRTRMTIVAPADKPPVKPSFWIQKTSRQKAGIGTVVAGIGVAVGSLLYTLIQGLRTKTRRRLMKVALDRIFGGSLEPLSKKEEAIINSLYRDLGIGAGGVVLGGIGAGAGVYLYNQQQTAAAAA